MSEVLRRVSDSIDTPDLDALGGENLVLAERAELVADPRNVAVVAALSSQWDELGHRDEAVRYIVDSIRASDPATLVDVLDVTLASARTLYDVAAPLTTVLSELGPDPGILGAIALEGWTRLALGNWCTSLQLRAALVSRAQGPEAEDGGTFLVRAIGAALERWGDPDLLSALSGLTSYESIDDDAAYEMAMYHLNEALSSANRATAIANLQEALRWFRIASATDERPDALAFSLAVEQVVRFVAGERITAQSVDKVRESVLSYLRGYSNEARHWRQPRADAAACWADLTRALHEVADLQQPAWWEPGKLLAAAARVLDAHRSLVLLGEPDNAVRADRSAGAWANRAREPSRQSGLELMLRPPVQAALGSREENLALVDRWLEEAEAASSNDSPGVAAVREVREALRREVKQDPKGPLPSVPALSRILGLDTGDLVKFRPLLNHPEVLEQLEARAVLLEDQPGPTVTETAALSNLLSALREVPGYGDAAMWIDWMVQQLLRFVMFYLDKQGGGGRAEPWQRPFTRRADAPKEEKLADSLARWLMATTGVRAQVEVSNIGGGRVDVIVFVDALRLVVEAKREFEDKGQDELVVAYGDQAVQYASADVPFTFLVVLDLFRRVVRADVQSCVWVRHVTLPAPGSRTYGLTTARVQANLEPPSVASWGKKASSPRPGNRSRSASSRK